MAGIRMRTRLCLGLTVLLFALFLIGITERGQRYLIGKPSSDHWQRDDQYMGAGLAPYVYCLAPGSILAALAAAFYAADRKRGLAK